MTATSRYVSVPVEGDAFDAYVAIPESGSGPGILVFQEIFGINDNLRTIADGLAEDGYLAVVPDMFWRVERRFERKDESGMADAFALLQRFDFDKAVADIDAVHGHTRTMTECTGKVGAVGFCLGGGLAFAAATTSRVNGQGLDAVVCYYGSQINDLLGHVDQLECPAVFHYGERDPYISSEQIDAVEVAVAGRPDVEFYRYDAGHAFSNFDAPSMYDEPASKKAWSRTLEFFDRTLR